MGNMLCSVTNKPLDLETIEPKADEEVIVIKFEEVKEVVEEVVIKEETVKEEVVELKEEVVNVVEVITLDDSASSVSSVSTIKDDVSSISSQEEPVKKKRGRKKKEVI